MGDCYVSLGQDYELRFPMCTHMEKRKKEKKGLLIL